MSYLNFRQHFIEQIIINPLAQNRLKDLKKQHQPIRIRCELIFIRFLILVLYK